MLRTLQERPTALIEQDYVRRIILKEKDIARGFNIELIKTMTRMALDNSFDVILEGIFDAGRYENMFEELIQTHPKNNYFFYFDISFEETLVRHQSKPNKDDFGEKEMRRWYKEQDFLKCVKEILIPETNTLEDTVKSISALSGF